MDGSSKLVMGGGSTGAVGVEDGFGTETIKTVVDAPFLHFSKFIKMVGSGPFPDGSATHPTATGAMAVT